MHYLLFFENKVSNYCFIVYVNKPKFIAFEVYLGIIIMVIIFNFAAEFCKSYFKGPISSFLKKWSKQKKGGLLSLLGSSVTGESHRLLLESTGI